MNPSEQSTGNAPEAKPFEPSFEAYSEMYQKQTGEFVKAGSSVMQRLTKAQQESADSKAQLKILGLQFAVLGRQFFTNIVVTADGKPNPMWFGKTVEDFIKFTYGLKDKEKFPALAWQNARLVLAAVVPDKGEPLICQKNYLALTQNGITQLFQIVTHKSVMISGVVDRENALLKDAVKLANEHGDGYVSKLRDILRKLNGEETKATEAPEMGSMTTEAVNLLKQSIARCADGQPADAKALFFALEDLKAAYENCGVSTDDMAKWAHEYDAAHPTKPEEKKDDQKPEEKKPESSSAPAETPAPQAPTPTAPAEKPELVNA